MNKDLTTGKPEKVLWQFCLPLFGSIIFQQLYNIADSFVAGKFISDNALAAVGNSYEITLIFIAFAFGCNIACSVLAALFFGAKQYNDLKTTVYTALISSCVICAVLMLVGTLCCDSLLRLIKTPEEVFADSKLYLDIYIYGLPFVFLYNVATGIFSALGDSKTPFIFLACSSTSNIAVDILFVTAFNMGVAGVAFFGPQRGVIGVNYKPEDLKWGLWETIETRAFPGSVSNHHLGTLLGQLMAAYEMNAFKDEYQRAVIENAKSFAASLKAEGLDVAGDPAVGYTETHQVIVRVGYARGPEIAKRLEENNIICNYQATPDEEGFTASGALRMGVNEMTRFGFGREQFAHLAHLIADCILRNADVREEAARLREGFTDMRYCFSDAETEKLISALAEATGI